MAETRETREKRLMIRANRRGIKEMDLLLGGFARTGLPGLDAAGLDGFESLLAESDLDILAWVTGQAAIPEHHGALVAALIECHRQIRADR
jgi:antitoxin CptB